MVRNKGGSKLKGYEKLNSSYRALFAMIHTKHLASMNLQQRKKYELSQIEKIELNRDQKRLEIQYNNGSKVHYNTDLSWEEI